jgi:hypothetical protein
MRALTELSPAADIADAITSRRIAVAVVRRLTELPGEPADLIWQNHATHMVTVALNNAVTSARIAAGRRR